MPLIPPPIATFHWNNTKTINPVRFFCVAGQCLKTAWFGPAGMEARSHEVAVTLQFEVGDDCEVSSPHLLSSPQSHHFPSSCMSVSGASVCTCEGVCVMCLSGVCNMYVGRCVCGVCV